MPVVFFADSSVQAGLTAWKTPGVEMTMQVITRLGEGVVNIGLPLVLGLLGRWNGDRALWSRGLLGAAAVAGAGILDQVVKNVACRARPSVAEAGTFFVHFPCVPAEYAFASFPSGHATTAFAVATLLALWYPRWAAAFLGLAALVGLSRIVLGVHYPSDVVAGALLGTTVALAAYSRLPMLRHQGERVHRQP